ncbi:MAG: hypothetical protein FJ272_19635, partial [Planctomycetes bacterium]|nr:hypothetical protein [Planctomycetota bacterium]
MMRKQASALAALSFLSASVFAQPSGARAVSVDEQKAYLRWLLPLPKEVTFLGKTRVAVGSLRLVLDSNASDSFVTAADDLRALLKEKAGVDAPAAPEKAFTIRLGLRGSKVMEGVRGIPDLSGLPNAEQAYAIVPIRETGERLAGYALVGQGEPGAYYAAQTFGQLLEGALHKAKVADEIELPVVAIRDWPDLGERGFWGSYGPGNAQDIAFMARRRFNLVETHTPRRFTEGGAYTAAIDPGLMAAARKHAVKLVPVITHLDHLPKSLFEKLPELLAKGEKGKVGELQAACHAHPAYQKLLNDWMRSLAEHEGVEDVCAWLSELENCPRCSCDECSRENWFAGEARLLVRAWQEARKVEPTLRLRILLTQGSYSHNDLVLKAVPPEVGISYYSGVHTYSVSREPMIYPLLREFAQGGRWLGVYPQLLAVWAYNTPFSCPQLVQFR